MFLVGYVFGPVPWGPGPELIGRRPVLIFSLSLYTTFHLGQALAQDMETIIIWDPVNRGIATSVFATNIFLGPVLGPVIGGYVAFSHLGWRWVFWILMIFAGSCTLLVFGSSQKCTHRFYFRKRHLLALDPEKNRDFYAESENVEWTISGLLNSLLRPFKMLLVEPILLVITKYISVVCGVIYAMFEAFPVIFIRIHTLPYLPKDLSFVGV